MTFDVWVVAFGLSRVLPELKLIPSPKSYSVLVLAMVLDAYLLYVFFKNKKARALLPELISGPQPAVDVAPEPRPP